MADNIIAQPQWHWCSQCGSLWHGATQLPNNGSGVCPASPAPKGGHSGQGSGDYVLFDKPASAFNKTIMAQPLWRWCKNCECLWHALTANPGGACAATKPPGGAHSTDGSGDYALLNDSSGAIG